MGVFNLVKADRPAGRLQMLFAIMGLVKADLGREQNLLILTIPLINLMCADLVKVVRYYSDVQRLFSQTSWAV